MKHIFVVNPAAGKGRAEKEYLPKIQQAVKKERVSYEIHRTINIGEGETYIRRLLTERKDPTEIYRFYGCGGDGTLNEVVNGIVDFPNVEAAFIPAGTGNDFVQVTGFHDRMTENDWELFFRKQVIPMDAGLVNGMIFINGMGLGFDAQVAAENYSGPGVVKKGGKHKYIWHIIKTILFFREKRMTASYGGSRTETDCFINTVSIGRRFAGGFLLTPGALANDGLLDVCSIKRLNLIQRLKLFMKVPKGEHIKDKKVFYFQTNGMTIEFPGKVPFHVDGELNFSERFDISIMPGALNIIYNPDGNHFFSKSGN